MYPGTKNASHTCVGEFFAENPGLGGEREIVGVVRNVREGRCCSKWQCWWIPGVLVFHYSSWLCGHPLQLTNAKPGACADWAVVSLVSSASSQGDVRDGGGSERFHTVPLSEVLDQVLMSIWVLLTSEGVQQMRSSASRLAGSCASPHTSTEVGVRSHAGWEEESGTTTSVCSFTAK